MRTKKAYSKSIEVAHLWANMENPSGIYQSGDRVSVTGFKECFNYYSYATIIGKYYKTKGVVLLSMERYSQTTSKHQSELEQATRHLNQIFVFDVNLTYEDNKRIMLDEIERLCSKQERARTADYSHEIIKGINNLYHYTLFTKQDMRKHRTLTRLYKGGYVAIMEHFGRVLHDKEVAKKRAYRKAQKWVKANRKEIEEYQRKRRNAFKSFTHLFSHEDREESFIREALRANRILGGDVLDRDAIFLRISRDGTEIETSTGASIPLAVAKGLWRRLERGSDVKGMKLGHYTVGELKKDVLIVGCHEIPLAEIEYITKELGLRESVA